MTQGWRDISVPVGPDTPKWPGSPGVSIEEFRSLDRGDASRDSILSMDVHCGTHLETSSHLIPGGETISSLDPLLLCGLVWVLDAVAQSIVESPKLEIPLGVKGILVRTDNSERRLMSNPVFQSDFVGWSSNFSRVMASVPGLRFVGADYLSVQAMGGDIRSHLEFMEHDIVIVEGLDLSSVPSGLYESIGMFICIAGAEASPARLVLREISE